MIGKVVSHYEIVDEISRGGMGIVYRAKDTKLDREVALKVLPAKLVAEESQRSRFFQEARAAAALKHPHIGVIYEIDEAEGVTFMALELIEGEQLSDTLARERLSIPRALELALEVAGGLASAHARGIVHRDLKPANIMVTDDGHSKIIDFGLAKLLEPLGDGENEGETVERRETDPGVVMGTIAYMSPEQARARKVDHRSDVFSFGVMLHEMLGGRLPFQGDSGVETLNAILKEPPKPLLLEAGTLGDVQRAEIERIVRKCLAKEPGERYQTMKDLAIDLKSVRRATDSDASIQFTPPPSGIGKWRLALGSVIVVALACAITFVAMNRAPTPEGDSLSAAAPSKPSVAVLFFDNQSGDPELDWLRTALTDMLVTDMSQSPNMDVLSIDRLYQIMEELNRLDERVTSFTVVEEVAERASVDRVVLGSFVKAGDTIRISVRIQDAASGEILTSERVEGVGEASIFSMVDDLTRRIKGNFDIPETAELDYDRGLSDVSTSSPEAYRYYVAGDQLHHEGKSREAIPLYEKAVDADPGFALALSRLGLVHGNVGHAAEAARYMGLAMEHADRLPANQRYYIEGNYHWASLQTFPQAIAAFGKAIELYPEHTAARNNLAVLLLSQAQPDPSIEHFEYLRARSFAFPGTHRFLSLAYTMRDEPQKGLQVVEDFRQAYPDSAAGHVMFADHFVNWGRLEQAEQALRAFEASSATGPSLRYRRWTLRILQERWDDANSAISRNVGSEDPLVKTRGLQHQAAGALYRGRLTEAHGHLDKAIRLQTEPDRGTANVRNYRAHVLLETGEPARALSDAGLARRADPGGIGDYRGLLFSGEAQAALGQQGDAETTATLLREMVEPLDSPLETLQYQLLQGKLALARGDHARAMDELRKAVSLCPPRGLMVGFTGPPQVRIWFALASANLDGGNEDEAAKWFQRVVDVGVEHVPWPILYVRSFYFLGQIHESRGEMDKAREHYQRFVDFWGDGEIDRDRVADARSKL